MPIMIEISDKERQLIVKALELFAETKKEDVLGLFLKLTKSTEFDDDELCDLTKKLTGIYSYRGM